MKLFIDGDALPNGLKPILLKAINRVGIETFVVANKRISLGASKFVNYIIVGLGADEADDKIVEMVLDGDLVITADIPLADRVLTKCAHAIDHRGGVFTPNDIKHYLSLRNFMQELRESGEQTNGPTPFSKKDIHEFANKLNQIFTKYCK
ncbi:MAG: YaiI/YqxD family protein [Candidatus Delongbacteria bacterium]|nr:YaiI/YqxD family protein [Candidatus Delongbacteria bacterium]MBN2836105.1 YaiI/YqxD family protein [Candidatus Delongbacteria bacterium]